MYYLYSENKGADQLCSYRAADLCKKKGFLMTRLIIIKFNYNTQISLVQR